MSCSIVNETQLDSKTTTVSSTTNSQQPLNNLNSTSNTSGQVKPLVEQQQNMTNLNTMTTNKTANSVNLTSLNGNGQIPSKIVQAGGNFIITTIYHSSSTQKVVTVAPSSNTNPQQTASIVTASAATGAPSTGVSNTTPNSNLSIINSNVGQQQAQQLSMASSSSVGSSSASSSAPSSSASSTNNSPSSLSISTAINNQPSSNQQQQQQQTNGVELNQQSNSNNNNNNNTNGTTTITLVSPINISSTTSSSSAPSSSTSSQPILYPLQTQQFTYVDTSTSNGSGSTNPNNTPTYSQQQQHQQQQQQTNNNNNNNLLTTNQTSIVSLTSPNRSMQTNQMEHSQPHQSIYTIYNDSSMIEMENSSMDYEGHVGHTAQAAPITVQWLIDNFEPAEGCSLRRSTLYNYYLHHCSEQRIEPVNPASFGKLIRSVFLGLRTRRLGTRGNSKYHYYGIRVKGTSPLIHFSDDNLPSKNHPLSLSPTGSPQPRSPNTTALSIQTHQTPNGSTPNAKRFKMSNSAAQLASTQATPVAYGTFENHQIVSLSNAAPSNVVLANKTTPQPTAIAKTKHELVQASSNESKPVINPVVVVVQADTSSINTTTNNNSNNNNVSGNTKPADSQSANLFESGGEGSIRAYLGDNNQMPNFGTISTEGLVLPQNCSMDDVKQFEELYKQHCEKILDMVFNLKLNSIESIWLNFWRSEQANNSFYEEKLPSAKFFNLCQVNQVIEFVKQCDYQLYQFCLEILIPDVLGSLPPNLVQSIRTLAKNLENWLRNALVNTPEPIKQSKLLIISTFSMTLRRYTSLNHLAQTVRNSLQNEQILVQMLNDISKVDFSYIKEQAKWTCECDEEIINKFEKEFKDSLRNHTKWSMNNWMSWLETSVNFYLQQYEHTDSYGKLAKQFLLKWSFLCSSIVRDLTLRSAASFGSFHLIRLLFDEYIYYLIEHRIAFKYQQTPLAILTIGELKKEMSQSSGVPQFVEPNSNQQVTTKNEQSTPPPQPAPSTNNAIKTEQVTQAQQTATTTTTTAPNNTAANMQNEQSLFTTSLMVSTTPNIQLMEH